MLSGLFKKAQKKSVKKIGSKSIALKSLKKTLNDVMIDNMAQTYTNTSYKFNKDKKVIKKIIKNKSRPHSFSKRPYTDDEKKQIMNTMKKKSVNNIYNAATIERLDYIDYYLNTEHTNFMKSKLQNLNTMINEKGRESIEKMILSLCKKQKLVIYGGLALNKYIDKQFDIYQTNQNHITSIDSLAPDYDIFSVDAFNDSKKLANILKKAGFSYIQIKRAKHENTWKLSVNHQPLIDITVPDSPIPFKVFDGVRYVTVDFLKAGLYKASADPSGGYYRWKKDALRLEKLISSENKHIRKHGKHSTYFSKTSPFQRFTSDFYGPISKSSFKSLGNSKWANKERENSMKKKILTKTGNKIKIGKKETILKEPKILEILNIPKNGNVPWTNNKASFKIK